MQENEVIRQDVEAETAILRSALLWLRNHYDVGKEGLKPKVLSRIDSVLVDYEPSIASLTAFRDAYPAPGSGKTRKLKE
jgi:hypothetical protein